MKKLSIKLGGMIASLAILITVLNVNTNCIAFIHQPKMPKSAKRLRKF